MQPTITVRLLLLVALAIGLSCAWLTPIDHAATTVVDSGLKRALVSFASARTLNAVLSVAQSTEFDAKPLGVGVSVTLGQALRPINELVGQFAELMLAASVVFGAMKVLIVIGASNGVSVLLTVVALCWAGLRWQGIARPGLLTKILLVLFLIRFAMPIVSVGSDAIFQQFLAADYQTAQSAIAGMPAAAPSVLQAAPQAEGGVLSGLKGWWSSTTDMRGHVESVQQFAENGVEHIVKLIVLFLLQTLVLPLFLFWILMRAAAMVLEPARRQP